MVGLKTIRSQLGALVFNHMILPPNKQSSRLTFHGGDYGHGWNYEKIFCRDPSDIEAAAKLCPSGPTTALDLGGGMGRFAVHLANLGKRVVLVDQSQTMLDTAFQRRANLLPESKSLLSIFHQDIRQLSLHQRFSTIFSIKNALEHLGDESTIANTLMTLQHHLLPGGKVYIEVHNLPFWENCPYWKTSKWSYSMDIREEKNRYRVWERTIAGSNSEVVWEHAVGTHHISYTLLQTKVHLFSISQWEDLFLEAGFCVEERWSSWSGKPLSAIEPSAIFQLSSSAFHRPASRLNLC